MSEDADRRRAAELYARAHELHENLEYYEARPLYEESLKLHEDADVRAEYNALMATIGPM
jgi:hypothetical protein